MENYSVEYYETEDGTRPAEDFILSQDKKMRAKLFMSLELLEIKGPELREPYSKPLGDGIFEVRAKQGSDISRMWRRNCQVRRRQSRRKSLNCRWRKAGQNTSSLTISEMHSGK